MKRVLIISDFFPPSNEIGSVRPSKIAKYLVKDGYEIEVFTKFSSSETNDYGKVYGYNGLNEDNFPSQKVNSSKPAKERGWLYKKLYSQKNALVDIVRGRRMLGKFKKFLIENGGKYDVVFSTYGPIGSLLCGYYYKKCYPDARWICDFRDPAVVDFIPFFKKIYLGKLQSKSCKKADEIVAVSNGYLERICNGKYGEKSHMIPNGYDCDDIIYVPECRINSGVLHLAYVGILYAGKRDLSPLFCAIDELWKEGKIDKAKIVLDYAGTNFDILYRQAQKYGVEDMLENHGVLKRKDCLQLQFESDILLLANWNTKKEYGVFPGKLLEYMLIGKPIVGITLGDIANSEADSVIKSGNLGFSFEESRICEDFPLLKQYIKEQYDNVICGNGVDFNPVSSVLDRYNCKNTVKKIKELIEK